ncbi:MAG TPA: hypothetical protein VI320_18920 [Terracidiphilus sp.]|jgi:hypothetical protein
MAIICRCPRTLLASLLVAAQDGCNQTSAPAWRGVLLDNAAQPIAQAGVKLDARSERKEAATDQHGVFLFDFPLSKVAGRSVIGSIEKRSDRDQQTARFRASGRVLQHTWRRDGRAETEGGWQIGGVGTAAYRPVGTVV